MRVKLCYSDVAAEFVFFIHFIDPWYKVTEDVPVSVKVKISFREALYNLLEIGRIFSGTKVFL